MTDKNPFKRLFRTSDVCGVLRVTAALGTSLYVDNVVAGIMVFILVSAFTDLTVLRPLFKKTFVRPTFTETDTAWLKEKQDISPENLMVFFRKIITFRALSLGLAVLSIPVLWMVKGLTVALGVSLLTYMATFFILFSYLRLKHVLPTSYRYVPARSENFHAIHASSCTNALDRIRTSPTPYSLEWNVMYRGESRTGI